MEEKSFNQVEFEDYIKNDKGKSLSSFIINKIDNQHQKSNHITKFEDIRIDFKGITHEVLLDFYNIECKTISISNYDISDKNPNELPNIYFNNIKAENIYIRDCKFNSLQFIEDESNFTAFHIIGSSITEVNMNSNLNGQLIIQKSNFVNINLGNYKKITINEDLKFNHCNIDGRVAFKDFIFKGKVLFHCTTFRDNIYFNNSIFKDYTSFYYCEFEKTASFYGSVFKKSPNFFQSIFRESINVVNTNLKFNFEDLQTTINQEYDTCKEDTNSQKVETLINYKNKSLDNFANDFRDSFRILKNTLIKDNNLLDASNFHKYELYSKEVELKHKKTKTLKDKVEKWQLWFYRKLCDHHTDLVLNLKWLIIAIGLFACLYFIAKVFQNINILNILSPLGVFLSILSFLILFCMCYCKCIKIFDFFAYLSVIPTLWVICYKPKLIFGIANLVGNKNYNGFENALITIYTILLALVLFSLQKTARKNSIVPN